MPPTAPVEAMPVAGPRDLGPLSARRLAAGAANAYNLCRARGYNVPLNLPRALAGALAGIYRTKLPPQVKAELRARLDETS